MIKNVIWSSAAEKDLNIISDYILLNWNSLIHTKFINKVDDAVNLLAENPKLFPEINLKLKIRKSVITKHNSLFYRELKGGKLLDFLTLVKTPRN